MLVVFGSNLGSWMTLVHKQLSSAADLRFEPEYCQHIKSAAVSELNAKKMFSGVMSVGSPASEVG